MGNRGSSESDKMPETWVLPAAVGEYHRRQTIMNASDAVGAALATVGADVAALQRQSRVRDAWCTAHPSHTLCTVRDLGAMAADLAALKDAEVLAEACESELVALRADMALLPAFHKDAAAAAQAKVQRLAQLREDMRRARAKVTAQQAELDAIVAKQQQWGDNEHAFARYVRTEQGAERTLAQPPPATLRARKALRMTTALSESSGQEPPPSASQA